MKFEVITGFTGKRNFNHRVQETFQANGISYTIGNFDDGRLCYIINGRKLTPGEAAALVNVKF